MACLFLGFSTVVSRRVWKEILSDVESSKYGEFGGVGFRKKEEFGIQNGVENKKNG